MKKKQSGQQKSLLARQSSSLKNQIQFFFERCLTTISALMNFAYVKHYYQKKLHY